MQRSPIASRMRALAGSPLTPVLSALAAAGVGCGRQQAASQPPPEPPAQPAEARPDAAPDALDQLFRDGSPEAIAAQLEKMLDAADETDSPDEASAAPPGPTTRPKPPPPRRDPEARPIYRGVDV